MSRRPPALWEETGTTKQIALALPVSLGLHGVLVALVAVQAFFFQPARIPEPSYEVMLVGPIKKGTPGGGASAIPKAPAPAPKTPSGPTPQAPAPGSEALTLPAGTPIPDPKDARAEAMARAQREAALRRAAEAAARNASAATAQTPIPSAGGVGATANAPGGSGEGAGDGGSEFGVEWSELTGAATYEQQIQAIVTELWLPSLGSERKVIQSIVRVKIAFDGSIASVTMESASDDAAFNASVLATFRKIPENKFPPPPIDLKPYLAKRGVPLRFDSRTKKGAAGP